MASIRRRIITENDRHGHSRAEIIDKPRLRGITAEIWRTTEATASSATLRGVAPLEPPPGGSVFRFFRVMPEGSGSNITSEERERLYAHHFAEMGAAHCRPDTSRHVGMHRTATLDYIILLSGRVTLLLDNDEIALQPFDVVVQRATNHAWVNRGEKPALLMAVLIDDPAARGDVGAAT
jgi:hypothetical protein